MTLAQIRVRDKLHAAKHEAGHITYGEAKGMPVSGRLRKNPDLPRTFADLMREKYWLGRVYYRVNAFARLSNRQKAALGLAGAIAQDGVDSAESVMDCWTTFDFSETDLLYIPRNWEEKRSTVKFVQDAVEEAIAVLSSNNIRLNEIVDILVREEVYNKQGLRLEEMEETAVRLF